MPLMNADKGNELVLIIRASKIIIFFIPGRNEKAAAGKSKGDKFQEF